MDEKQGAQQCAAGLDVLGGQACVVEKHNGPLLGYNMSQNARTVKRQVL